MSTDEGAKMESITYGQIQVTIEVVTPEVAEVWLGKNTHNRPKRDGRTDQYAGDMAAGAFLFNGETMKFDTNGAMMDGQHRCFASILSGKPFRTIVVRGLPPKAQDTVDTGLSRKFSDILKLRGEPNYINLGSVVRSVYHWRNGARQFSGKSGRAASNHQLLTELEALPYLRDAVATVSVVSSRVHLPMTVSGALWYAFQQISPVDADDFFTRLCSDQDHSADEPIYMLRRWLQRSHEDYYGTRNTTVMAAVTIKAWNFYRDGASVKLLVWRAGGASPERFPEPH